MLDANVQKIVDAGFSEEQAENALRYTKNNVDRALRVLQKRDISENRTKDKPQKELDQPPKRKGRHKEQLDEDIVPVKPSGKVSLFDFLEDKLPNVPEKDKSSRQQNYSSYDSNDRNEKGYRDRNGARNNVRPQSSKYDGSNRNRSDNRGHFSNDSHHSRDDRKYQSHTQNEKPPRFQKKLEEKNKQHHQQQNQSNHYSSGNMNVNLNPYNNYQSQQNQYNRPDRSTGDKGQFNYRNNANSMDGLVEATANLNMLSNHSQTTEELQQRHYQQEYPKQQQHQQQQSYVPNQQNMQPDIQPFRRSNDIQKYQQESYRRPPPQNQSNGYMDQQQQQQNPMYNPNVSYMNAQAQGYPNRQQQYGYAGRPQEFGGMRSGGPFLPGSLLGFQNAAVNEQARAMLGVAEINWKVGDRCLALYWEDNNVSYLFLYC